MGETGKDKDTLLQGSVGAVGLHTVCIKRDLVVGIGLTACYQNRAHSLLPDCNMFEF